MTGEVLIRPPRREDIPAIVEALNAHSLAVHGAAEESVEDLTTWFDAPDLDLERDGRVAVLPGGEIAGYGDVVDRARDRLRYYVDLRMRPGYDGTQLLAELEGHARELAADGAVLRGFLAGAEQDARNLYEASGYRLVRHSLRMLAELDGPPPPPAWPASIDVRTFEPGVDDEAAYGAHMEAFADHWEFVRFPYEEWRHWMLAPPFDPAVWFLACEGDEIVGLCLCRPEQTGYPEIGWVSVLGVRPRWRRRGLGLGLLQHAFAEFYRRGKSGVGLGVDAENTTGAVRLYERAGMAIHRRYDIVEKSL